MDLLGYLSDEGSELVAPRLSAADVIDDFALEFKGGSAFLFDSRGSHVGTRKKQQQQQAQARYQPASLFSALESGPAAASLSMSHKYRNDHISQP